MVVLLLETHQLSVAILWRIPQGALSHRGIRLPHIEERARHRKSGASCRTSRTRSPRDRASEYAVDLGRHDEVVLMRSLDLLGLQRDRRIAPTEADIWMMAFSLREFTNLLNKSKRLLEIATFAVR